MDYMQLRYRFHAHPQLNTTFTESISANESTPSTTMTSTVYVSHTRNNNFIELVEVLEQYSKTNEGNKIEYVFWIDIFLISQFANTPKWYPQKHQQAIQNISSTIFILSSLSFCRKPSCFSRTWILFELFLSYQRFNSADSVIIQIHPNERTKFNDLIIDDINAIVAILSNIDLLKSTSKLGYDSRILIDYLSECYIPSEVTASLSFHLKSWFVTHALNVLSDITEQDDYNLLNYAGDRDKVLLTMSRIAYLLGNFLSVF